MKYRKGLTLIEVIIALAIIGMISISVMSIFSTGLNNIVKAGNRTVAINEEQKNIDMLIDNYKNIDEKEIDLQIIFTENLKIDVKGKIVSSSDDKTKITTFVPKP